MQNYKIIKILLLITSFMAIPVWAKYEKRFVVTKFSNYANNKSYGILELVQIYSDPFPTFTDDPKLNYEEERKLLCFDIAKMQLPQSKNFGKVTLCSETFNWERLFFLIPLGKFQYKVQICDQLLKIDGEATLKENEFILNEFNFENIFNINDPYEAKYIFQVKPLINSETYVLHSINIGKKRLDNSLIPQKTK